MGTKRSLTYALFTATAAAIGLLLMRAAVTYEPSLRFEFVRNRLTYLYIFLVTAAVFLSVGYVLGRRVEKFRRLSDTDALTGLSNRRAFEERLRQEWLRAQRYHVPLSLLVIDIDGLKRINDRHGHGTGDRVLRAAAYAMKTAMRAPDVGARWGGDEFAILAPNTSLASAEQLAQRLLGLVSDGTHLPDARLTASIGIATLAPERSASMSLDRLWQLADAALYEAKHAGGNRLNMA